MIYPRVQQCAIVSYRYLEVMRYIGELWRCTAVWCGVLWLGVVRRCGVV